MYLSTQEIAHCKASGLKMKQGEVIEAYQYAGFNTSVMIKDFGLQQEYCGEHVMIALDWLDAFRIIGYFGNC